MKRLLAFLLRHWDAMSGARARRNEIKFAADAAKFRAEMEAVFKRIPVTSDRILVTHGDGAK